MVYVIKYFEIPDKLIDVNLRDKFILFFKSLMI